MTSNSPSSSKIKDEESNASKKNLVNGTGSGTIDVSTLRRSTRESSNPLMSRNSPRSNPQMSKSAPSTRGKARESLNQKMSTSSPSTRKSERLVKLTSMSASPLINRKSERIHTKLTPSPLRRSDRGQKQTSSSSSGSRKFDKASVAIDLTLLKAKKEKSLNQLASEVSRSEDSKSAQVKRTKLDGRAFKALFKTQQTKAVAAERNGIKSPKRDGTIEETLANAEKLLVDYPREEQLETPELVGFDLIRKSVDAGIDMECGDSTKLSKRKRDLVMDFDASAIDVACSKRQRVDDDARGKDFCSYTTLIANVSLETSNIEKPESEAVEVGKKRKKVGDNCINPSRLNPGLEQDKAAGGASGIPGDNGLHCLEKSDACATNTVHKTNASRFEESTMPDAQKNLHRLLKPDILKLCEILKLSDEVKIMADRFLEYVIANHQVHSEKENILQALLISLCWSAASLLKQRVGRKESLTLAKHHLNFTCDEKEAEYVYSALRKLKKPFIRENLCESDFSKDNNGTFIKGKVDERMLQSTPFNSQTEIRDEVSNDEIAQDDVMDKKDTEKKMKLIQKTCNKRIAKLDQNQEEEIKKLNRYWEERQLTLENKHRVESAIIKEVYCNKPIRIDKLKALDSDYRKKLEELKLQKEENLEQLKSKHLDALSDESKKVTRWLNTATSSAIEVAGQDELPLHGSDIQNRVGYSRAAEHGCPDVLENDILTIKAYPNSKNDEVENLGSVNGYVARSQQPNGLGGSISVHGNTGSTSQYYSEYQNPDRNLLLGPRETILPKILERITKKVIGDTNSLELGTEAIELDGGNDRLRGESPSTPNAIGSHLHSGEANTYVGVDSPSTEMLQPASSSTCNQVVVPSLQPVNAKEVKHRNHDALLLEVAANVEQIQMKLSTDSFSGRSPIDLPLASGSTPQTLDERHTPSQCAEVQLSEDAMELSGRVFSLAGQNVEQNPPMGDRERPLADKLPVNQPNISKIPQEMVECTALLPNQVHPHLGANVELHPPSGVSETLQQNLLDLSSSSHQPLNLNASFLNSEAVPQVIENAAELPTQAVIHTRVNMPVVQRHNDLSLHAEHQVPSQIPMLTSYGDPLQNELEGIRKEIEQANKVHEDVNIRLDSELQEHIAQVHRTYEAKRKDAKAAFLRKKKELDDNHNKVLMNKILADAFRSKCVEASRYTGMQQVVHPLHIAPRSSSIAITSSAGQPAASQQNTTPMLLPSARLHPISTSSTAHQPVASQQNTAPTLQPTSRLHPTSISSTARQQNTAPMLRLASRLHPISASSMARQPATSQQNTTPILQPASRLHLVNASSTARQPAAGNQHNTAHMLQPASRLHPINASSTARQTAASQQDTTPLVQPASMLHPINASSAVHQPAASQQNIAPVLQPASRLHQISASSMAHQAAASQQNIAVPLHHGMRLPVTGSSSGSQSAAELLIQPEPGDNLIPVLNSADQPAASQQNTARQLRPAAGTFPISVSSVGPPVASQQSTLPPLQIVHQSAALFSGTPTRPPQINPITPLTGNLRVGSENCARAPAPHLQAFRSTASVNFTSMQRTMPSHLAPSSLSTCSSNSTPHALSSSGASPIPTNYCSPNYSRPLQSNSTKFMLPPGLSTPISASMSHQELLKDIHKQHIAHRIDGDSSLPLGLKLDSVDLSVIETGPSMPPVSSQELAKDIRKQHTT